MIKSRCYYKTCTDSHSIYLLCESRTRDVSDRNCFDCFKTGDGKNIHIILCSGLDQFDHMPLRYSVLKRHYQRVITVIRMSLDIYIYIFFFLYVQ